MSAIAPKHPRVEDGKFLDYVRRRPCLICKSLNRSEAAHVRYGSLIIGKRYTGKGEKPDDRWAVPLCEEHHRTGKDAQHKDHEERWWIRHDINPLIIAALLYSHYMVGDEAAGNAVVQMAETICG